MWDNGDGRSVGGLGWWSLECPAGVTVGVWLPSEQAARPGPVTAWLETGARHRRLSSGLPAVAFHDAQPGGEMFTIGIDPHRGSHTAAVLDEFDDVVDELCVIADRRQRDRLLEWAARFEPRVWAIEGATGTGALLAQQLVASGEHVLDVPPALSARVRLLDSGRSDKTDSHDARSAAVVARRHRSLRQVRPEDHIVGAATARQTPSRPGRGPDQSGVPAPHHAVPPHRGALPEADDRPAGRRDPRPGSPHRCSLDRTQGPRP